MKDLIYLGPTPPEENCLQVGQASDEAMLSECRRYVTRIREYLGKEVGSAKLYVKENYHDLGSYYEVVCSFDPDDEIGLKYALKCENDGPLTWRDEDE